MLRKGIQKIIKCDFCNSDFTKVIWPSTKQKLFFCSIKCSSNSRIKGGRLNVNIEDTNLERYGEISALITPETRKKIEETTFKNFGFKTPFEVPSIKDKIAKTNLVKYGTSNPAHSDVVKAKAEETNLRKYGYKSPLQSSEIKKQTFKTNIERYGTIIPMRNKEIKAKYEKTLFENYGVTNPTQSDEIKNKIDYIDLRRKGHITMKERGNYKKSKQEDLFYTYLVDYYGNADVERLVIVNSWAIDFYIESSQMYIQFDGEYWHGLDRPIATILEFKNFRDRGIYKTYLRDKEQELWFKQNNLKLVRIISRLFLKSPDRLNFIKNLSDSC